MIALRNTLTDATTSLRKSAGDVVEDLQTRTKDAWQIVQHRSERVAHESAACVRENAVPISLAAFGFGFVLGLCLNRRVMVSLKDRYISDPLHNASSVLPGLLIACAMARRRSRYPTCRANVDAKVSMLAPLATHESQKDRSPAL